MRLTQPRWPGVLSSRFVIDCATLGALGRKLPAPGTWGSVAGLLYFLLFFGRASAVPIVLGSLLASYLAVAICGEAEIRMKQKDPGAVVLDEVVAIPLCFLGWQSLTWIWPAWVIFVVGVLLFRFFDILKPLGISRLQRLPAGWGVVADDLAAALAACGALHLLGWVWTKL